ncbi:dioxygenase family protein [Nitrospira sp. M1]
MSKRHHRISQVDPPGESHPQLSETMNSRMVTRRSMLKMGVGAAGWLATSGVGFAALCPSVTTPRQTRGPYFPYDLVVSHPIRESEDERVSLIEANDNDLTRIKGKEGIAKGHIIYFQGQVLQSLAQAQEQSDDCQPLAGTTVFLWQANFSGRYNHQRDEMTQARFRHPVSGSMIERVHDEFFQYWGKALTDEQGRFQFKTILPGFYPAADGWYRPPHLHFSIHAPGYPELVTQTYFTGQALPDRDIIHQLNRHDHILQDPHMSTKQREQVIIDYQRDPTGVFTDGLVGTCQFLLPS